jgi:alpha-glucosidase
MRRALVVPLSALAVAAAVGTAAAEELYIAFPDGRVVIAVRQAEARAGQLEYSVACALVLEPSHLGIIHHDVSFDQHLTLDLAGSAATHDEAYTLVHGKHRQGRDHYNERTLVFRNATGGKVEIQIRAYDDGAAFRDRFPGDGQEKRTIIEEHTGFRLPEGSRVWAMPFDGPNEYWPAYEAFW